MYFCDATRRLARIAGASEDSALKSLARLVSAHSVFVSNVEAPYLPLPPPVLPRGGGGGGGHGLENSGATRHSRLPLEPEEWRLARGEGLAGGVAGSL
jgi:hypothetical protein